MTGKDMIEAYDKWMAEHGENLVRVKGVELSDKFCVAFLAGIEAAEAIWRTVPTVEAK